MEEDSANAALTAEEKKRLINRVILYQQVILRKLLVMENQRIQQLHSLNLLGSLFFSHQNASSLLS
jgi:hypothetical protein